MEMFLIIGIVILIVHILLIIYCKRKFKELRKYMRAINDGNYNLDIADNKEGEYSKLKNELYKVTVSLKEAAEISSKEKETLSDSITNISHQLKTPLTSMRIMLDNIEENPDMDEETKKEFLKDISNQVDWINSLIISLLKLAKFDANAVSIEKREIDVRRLIDNVIGNLSILLDIKNITLNVNVNDNPKFVGDYKWELEALTNILKNAIEHSSENASIDIKVEDTNLFIKIIIKDHGEGISIEDKKHIFERFYKSKNAGENSIGVGLSLAKAIIEKDGGYVEVESEAGKGTNFIIKYLK